MGFTVCLYGHCDDTLLRNYCAAEMFARGHTQDAVAAEWVSKYEEHNASAMCDLVNFVLRCTGCNLQVDVHEIGDPDNIPSKLTDLQDEYQAQKITDYPLISKTKGNAAFRATLTGFFDALINTAHASSLLYNDLALIENIQAWVTTTSSSAIRPFRHTATVISLAIAGTLCDIANEIAESSAKTLRQMEGEKKKKSVNKGRVAALQEKITEGDKKRETLEGVIKDIFDTVFVHRYRDVDPKIRADCVAALGNWIITLPDVFFEGQYLRYLGWVLSDTAAPTRAEVIKQLQKLFKNKDNIGGLRTFTERFRPRLVEMATRDAEASVRASTVELLDLIREAGFLEPDDVDSVGRLVFDSEPRVRKAVVGFFAENINDLYESKTEQLGVEGDLDDALGDAADVDFDSPRRAWLKLKCLVEVLQSYDSDENEELPTQIERGAPGANEFLAAAGVDSRFSLAAQALYDEISKIQEWEVTAGYLLFDHSEPPEGQSNDDAITALLGACKLEEREEIILLEVLNTAVKLRLTKAVESEVDKKGKKTKARKEESREIQETAALHLAQLIPRLLKKFGAVPTAASAVLRLEHVLNLEVFQQLRQDSTTYSTLLDDINKQFLTHTDQHVLVEASAALLHAKGFEELEEVTEGKVQLLWEDTINTLRASVADKDVTTRGSFNSNSLTELSNTVRRVSNLAVISDCTTIFEAVPPGRSAKKNNAASANPLNILLDIMNRGVPGEDMDENIDEVEDELVASTSKTVLFYFMWKTRALQTMTTTGEGIPDVDVDEVQERRAAFVNALTSILKSRSGVDELRLTAYGTLLDLFTLFATLRHGKSTKAGSNQDDNAHLKTLVQEISPEIQTFLTSIYAAVEKAYAKKSRRNLETADDDDPVDLDLESEPEDSDEDDDERERERQHAALLAEQKLCELAGKIVLAIIARVLDASGPSKGKMKERLNRNKGKLGQNFKEVIAYLDEPKAKRSHQAKAKRAGKGAGVEKSKPVVVEDEIEEEEEEEAGEAEPVEEGGEEDLKARELVVEDDIEDDSGGGEEGDKAPDEVEDNIMGD